MTRPITCKESEKDCTWSFNEESMEKVWLKLKEHILLHHKEVELNPENIKNIKSLIKVTKRFWWWG